MGYVIGMGVLDGKDNDIFGDMGYKREGRTKYLLGIESHIGA